VLNLYMSLLFSWMNSTIGRDGGSARATTIVMSGQRQLGWPVLVLRRRTDDN
jgi:hypothetical protein